MQKFYFLFAFTIFSLGFSQSISLYNTNLGGAVYGPEQYFCTGEKFDLKVDAVASSTGDYLMTGETPGMFPLSAGSTPITFMATGTDKFSNPIDIGFSFSFYGIDYTKVVAGSNGRLVFTNDARLNNLVDNTTYIDRTFNVAPNISTLASKDYNKVFKNNPSQELDLAQIFFGYTNLVPKSQLPNVAYYYKRVTYNGKDGLLISFQNLTLTDYSSSYDSSVLLLQDGKIVIYVNQKTRDNYNAILGIQNESGTKAKVPLHSSGGNYNNGPWKSEGKAWLFTPNKQLTPVFKWTNNGNPIGANSDTLSNFTPSEGDVVKLEVTYLEDASILKTNQVIFKKIPTPVISSNSAGGCVSDVTLTVPNDPYLNFEWYREGNTTVLGTGNSYDATATGNYYVRALRKTLPICSVDSAPFSVNLNSTIPAFNATNLPLNFCDTTGAASKTINLYDYYPQNPSYTVLFTEGTVPVPNPANFVIAGNTVRNLNIKVNDAASGCSIDKDFPLRFDALPAKVTDLPKRYCFGETSVDVSQYLQDLAGPNFSVFDYEYSTNGTTYTSNFIFNPTQNPKIWVKISPKNSVSSTCTTISTIIFTEDPKVTANVPTTQLPPKCASAQTFDLASLIPEINPDPNVTVTFHNTLQDATTGSGAVSYNFRSGLGLTTLYIRAVSNITGCVSPDHPSITLLVYNKPNVLVNPISQSNCAGNTVFNLTQNADQLTDAAPPVTVTLEYYSTNGALLTPSQITNYDASIYGANPYIKVIYNTTCSDIINFNLAYNPKPVANQSDILICSETTYSLQDFKIKAVGNPSNYTFTDLSGNPLPASFDLTLLPQTINFLLKDNITGCTSDPQAITFVKGGNSPLLTTFADITECDSDFDGKTAFNLDSKKTIFTNDGSATFEYFKDAGLTQSISSNYTNETAFAQTVYVRITIPGFCPTVAKINLKVNTPTKSSKLDDKYFICYQNTVSSTTSYLPVKIDAGTENDYFLWSDGQTSQVATFDQPGNYSVTYKKGINGCPYTHTFTISDENQPKIQVINQTNISIEVIANGGEKPYLYYFNGVPQTSNILQNPTASSYDIQVESATGCFGPPQTVYFIKINNAFTPNGDGINDVWKIENIDKMERVSIQIVDRNGAKVFESITPDKSEWDGKMNGRALPTSTYWYVVSWYDAVTQKTEQRQGWILLKNRD